MWIKVLLWQIVIFSKQVEIKSKLNLREMQKSFKKYKAMWEKCSSPRLCWQFSWDTPVLLTGGCQTDSQSTVVCVFLVQPQFKMGGAT